MFANIPLILLAISSTMIHAAPIHRRADNNLIARVPHGDHSADVPVLEASASGVAPSAIISPPSISTSASAPAETGVEDDEYECEDPTESTGTFPATPSAIEAPIFAPSSAAAAAPIATESAAVITSSSPTPTSIAASTAPSPTAAAEESTDFVLANGKEAQALNAKFAALTPDSACETGIDGCINGGFAQCVSEKWVVRPCGKPLTCFALPLVKKAGTSIACDVPADAAARIEATGAKGGITGA